MASGTGGEADSNPFRYNGQYTDEETGLIYLRNRYYDPETGRFTQEDPYWNVNNMIYGDQQFEDGETKIPDYSAIAQSVNLYVYCMSDPINGVDPTGFMDWRDASEIIRRNAQAIKDAGSYYGVNPAIIASCIYTELTWNVNWVDQLTDVPGYFADTSIGIGQVRVSTAKMLEDYGYIARTEYSHMESGWGYNLLVWNAPGVGQVYADNREQAIAFRLTSESECINYVAAYLKFWQDRWSDEYPIIDGDTAILATLYNQGEKYPPHSDPSPSRFGINARNEYYYMRDLLGI